MLGGCKRQEIHPTHMVLCSPQPCSACSRDIPAWSQPSALWVAASLHQPDLTALPCPTACPGQIQQSGTSQPGDTQAAAPSLMELLKTHPEQDGRSCCRSWKHPTLCLFLSPFPPSFIFILPPLQNQNILETLYSVLAYYSQNLLSPCFRMLPGSDQLPAPLMYNTIKPLTSL